MRDKFYRMLQGFARTLFGFLRRVVQGNTVHVGHPPSQGVPLRGTNLCGVRKCCAFAFVKRRTLQAGLRPAPARGDNLPWTPCHFDRCFSSATLTDEKYQRIFVK